MTVLESPIVSRGRCTVCDMRTLAIVNQKGGVGKTTLTLNLAAALVELGLRTLVVDMDPQGYATAGAGLTEEYDRAGVTLASEILGESSDGARSLVCQADDGFSVLPSNIDMFTVESRLTAARAREMRLKNLLAPLAEDFDFVLIDCPASLGALTDNAIVAAGEVVAPILPDGLSLRALELLLDQIDSIRAQLAVDVVLVGLVVNQYTDTNAARRVDADLEELPVKVLARIRKRVSATNSWEKGLSVFKTDPAGHIASVMRELASELVGGAK